MRCLLFLSLLTSSSIVLAFGISSEHCPGKGDFSRSSWSTNSYTVKKWGRETHFDIGEKVLHKGSYGAYWHASDIIDITDSGVLTVCNRSGRDYRGKLYSIKAENALKYEQASSYTYPKMLTKDLIYQLGDKVRFTGSGSRFECAVSKIKDITSDGYFQVDKPSTRYIEASKAYQYKSVSTYTDKRWGEDITVNTDDIVRYSELEKLFQPTYQRQARVVDISSDGYLTIRKSYSADPQKRDHCLHISRVKKVE